MAFIGVRENHVVLLPSGEMRCPEIEAHLNWLLTQAFPALTGDQRLRLSNRVPPDREEEVKNAREIHFSTDISIEAQVGESGHRLLRPAGATWEGIKALLKSLGQQMADVTSDLEIHGLTASTPVDIDIFLKWPRRGRKDERHMVLDKIATGLRHVDTEIDYEILTRQGKITKGDFILRKPRTVHCRGERPVRDLLFNSMKKWLAELLESGQIA
jgi:hypothetical protein